MKINPKLRRICLYPRTAGGGPATFQANLARGLATQRIEVTYDTEDLPYGALLVTGGTRHLQTIQKVRRAGIPVVQRLNGMNWIHRRRLTGVRHFLRAEYGNFILRTIRNRFADHVIYQSQFAQEWWERVEGPTPVSSSVVYNAVDLEIFSPVGPEERPQDRWRVLLVEGNLTGGYEVGLEFAFGFAGHLDNLTARPVELMIVGQVPSKIEAHYRSKTGILTEWFGKVPNEQVAAINRSAHVLFSADLNPACPNAVLEALGCGLPVAAFATGALAEIVTKESGRIVAYGGDPWKIDPPNQVGLAEAAVNILEDQPAFRNGARIQAEALFDLQDMVAGYLRVFERVSEL